MRYAGELRIVVSFDADDNIAARDTLAMHVVQASELCQSLAGFHSLEATRLLWIPFTLMFGGPIGAPTEPVEISLKPSAAPSEPEPGPSPSRRGHLRIVARDSEP